MIKRSATDKAEIFMTYWRMFAPRSLPDPVEEYNFDHHLGRRHRFDFAWVSKRVGVEVNGNAWNTRGGGRHGSDSDLEKLNLAMSLNWRVFQFSPAMLKRDPQGCVEMVASALKLERITA